MIDSKLNNYTFQAPAQYLLSAAVMSAPATMAVSKINWPETEKSITKDINSLKLEEKWVCQFIYNFMNILAITMWQFV